MELLNALLQMFGMGTQEEKTRAPQENALYGLLPQLLGIAGTPQYTQPTGQSTHPQWGEAINKAATEHGVNPLFMEAIMGAESGGNPKARSPVGAGGLMQLMPSTADYLGVKNMMNPEENIWGAAKYIKELAGIVGDNPELVAAAYNAGPGAVKKHGMKIPPYTETQAYVPKVMKYFTQQK